MSKENNKIQKFEGFKRFSDMKGGGGNIESKKSKIEEVDPSDVNPSELELPANPNVPTNRTKIEKPMSRKGMMPEDEKEFNIPMNEEPIDEKNVHMFGKVAKFPKKTKASKAYNFLENVKISKNSVWYILVEKQDNELQMVKYNNKKGVDLGKFVNELKAYYLKKYSTDKNLCRLVESIKVGGKNEFSVIQNIPKIEIEGRKLISRITEDLIKLLSK